MACKDAFRNTIIERQDMNFAQNEITTEDISEAPAPDRLFFGVDSRRSSNALLQNNLTNFEWASRNKLYPNFWGRNINGENALTIEEIDFLHDKGCRIAAIYSDASVKETEEQGKMLAKKADLAAYGLGIPENTALFLEIGETENVTAEFMTGFAAALIEEGYTPGFMANTDAAFGFDREFSGGMQSHKDIFEKCLVWATAPSLKEYDRVTTTHLIQPDNWAPFAPSGITQNKIAAWQYGKNCHPISEINGTETAFNIDLLKDENIIINKMF